MPQVVESIMSNFMFICIPSIVYFLVWTKYRKQSGYSSKIVLFILLSISVILCLSFPYHYLDHYTFDFREVPLVIGVLYGGPLVGGALLFVLMAYRFIIGGHGTYHTLVIDLGIYLSLVTMTTRHRLNNRSQLIRALVVSTAIVPILIKLLLCWFS